jgi:catechol 2,3-dioxygenase-like lactoylglutathione lyase family enzyme
VIEINGMAHVILTVNRFDLARAFYGRLLPEFGMKPVYDNDKFFYCVGARTAIGICGLRMRERKKYLRH